jgi:hypothetical protein
MLMSHARWLSLAVPLSMLACRGAKEPAGMTRVTGASVVTATSAAQADRMPHCPNVVAGATTVVNEVPGGVELRIVAEGEGMNEVRRRAAFLSSAADETRGKHRGTGAGAAQFGRCPVVMRNTKLEVREIPGGAAVVVRPSEPGEVDWLRREVEARTAQLAAPKPFGPGMMTICPAAVANAQVTVIDKPYGVDVKLTERTPEGTRAIRERAKELAARGAGVEEERCPASAPNATLVAVEVPGGATVAIKAKRPEEVASLRRLVHERARSYEPPVIVK